jgi:hypothetical protein
MFNFVTPLWLFVILILALLFLGFNERTYREGAVGSSAPTPIIDPVTASATVTEPADTIPTLTPVTPTPVPAPATIKTCPLCPVDLTPQLTKCDSDLNTCNSNLATSTSALSNCNTNLATCNSDFEQAKSNWESEKQSMIETSNDAKSKYATDKKDLETASSKAESEYRADKEDLQKKIDDLSSQVSDLTSRLSQASSDRDTCYTERDVCNKQGNTLRDQLSQVSSERDQCFIARDKFSSDLSICTTEREKNRQMLEKCDKVRVGLTMDIEDKNTGYKSQIKKLESETGNWARQYNFDCLPKQYLQNQQSGATKNVVTNNEMQPFTPGGRTFSQY